MKHELAAELAAGEGLRDPLHILVLEDEASMAALLRHYLRNVDSAAPTLRLAETLQDAVALLRREPFDLVFSDLNLPDSQGLKTLSALLAHHSHIIVITGDDQPQLREAAMAMGAYEFIHKASLKAELLQRLARLASIHSNALRSLRESETRFRSLTALSSDWYWEQDADFRLTFVSSSMGETTGLAPGAFLGRRRWESPALNLNEEGWERHRAQLARHEPFREFEMERPRDDGTSAWLSLSGEPVFDKAGRFIGYRGVGRDITAPKREERLLRLEHEITRYLAQADAHDDGVISVVLRLICESEGWKCGRFFLLDEAAGLMRYEAGWSVPGAPFRRFIERSTDLGFAAGESAIGTVWQSRQPTWIADSHTDERMQRPGLWRDAGLRSTFLFPVMAGGVVRGAVSISSDSIRQPDRRLLSSAELLGSQIGQFLARKRMDKVRQEIERRFRQTFELAGSGIAHVDLEGRFVSVNRKVCQILGYSREELIGRAVKDISHPDDADLTASQRALVREGKLDSIHLEKRFVRKDGRVLWVDLTVAPANDDAGVTEYEIAVMEDISDRKRSEQLRQLEHDVNRYLANASAPSEALRNVMRAICESENWDAGRYFELDEAAGLMRFRESWWRNEGQVERWTAASRSFQYQRGQGLVGAAWKSGSPLCVPDMTKDPRVAHPQIAQETGMRGSFNFPVAFEGRTVGVISITSRKIAEPDAPLLQALGVIGTQVGQYLLRQRSEEARGRFSTALDAAADMVFLVNAENGTLLDFNATACRYLGYERAELLGCKADKIVAGQSLSVLVNSYQDLLAASDRSDSRQRTYRRKDGSTFQAEVLRRVVPSPDGPILVVNARDLTERRNAEQRQSAHLRYQEQISRLGQSALGMRDPAELIADALQSCLETLGANAITYVEPGATQGSVIARQIVGVPTRASAAVEHCGEPLGSVIKSGNTAVINQVDRPPLPFDWAEAAGSACLVAVGGEDGPRGAVCALSSKPQAFGPEEVRFLEATASMLSTGLKRIESEGRLAFLAQFDTLTGLPNRSLLNDRFSQMIVQARRHHSLLGVLFLDLDDFKLVNDTLGHAGGDDLLKEVAKRLKASVRAGDTVARISGDEFAVVLADLPRPDDAAVIAQKILESLSLVVNLHGQEVFASASIGIAVYPTDGQEPEALLAAADAAMYRAKESQRNTYQFFTAQMNQDLRSRAQLGLELHRALERDEFRLFYQPKIDLHTGRICGAEALLRWLHPERGVVPPSDFIPTLEDTGLVVPVGDWVLRRACEEVQAWRDSGVGPVPVAVNLSARQFRQPDLDMRIRSIVAGAGIEAGLIELEITESQLMHDPDQAIKVLTNLQAAGIRIAVDDFGTGYSSLAYLTRLPLAALKIDRSFVAHLLTDEAEATIVRTIVDMAKSLGLTVIAEGVETKSQSAFLRGLGCEQAQGYLFGRPMPADDFRRLLARMKGTRRIAHAAQPRVRKSR